MSNQYLKLRRSAVPGKVPDTASLDFGEIALNTHDGLAFMKMSSSLGQEVIAIGTGTSGNISGSGYYVPVFSGSTSLITSSIFQSGSFTSIRNATSPEDPTNPDILYVNGDGVETYNLISAHGNYNSYVQLNVQNYNESTEASSDIVATANNGTEESFYINMGINSEGFTNTGNIGGANDAYVYSTGNNLYIGNASAGREIVFFNGGLDAENNANLWIHDQGTVGINTPTYNTTNQPSLQVEAIGNTTPTVIQVAGEIDNYSQVAITNRSGGNTASADLALYNNIDPTTQLAGYVDLGINSTNYVYNGIYPGSAGDAYLFTDSEHLIIGSTSGSGNAKITLFAGGISESENAKLVLYGNNQHEMTGSLKATEGFTGSLYGTASWAENAITASYALSVSGTIENSISASYPIAVTGSSIYSTGPAAGIPTSFSKDHGIFLGDRAGFETIDAAYSIFLGQQSGYKAAEAYGSAFFLNRAGYSASYANNSFFLGYNAGYFATYANNSNFIGAYAGYQAAYAPFSNFIGDSAGESAYSSSYSNFIGVQAGSGASTSSYSTLIGYKAGRNASLTDGIGSNNIIIGTNITLPNNNSNAINIGGLLFGTGSYSNIDALNPFSGSANGRIGINQPTPLFNLDVSGSGRYTSGLIVTGSLIAPNITGSLFGTSSWALNAITASYALSVSGTINNAISASYAATASYVINAISSSLAISSSYSYTASSAVNSANALTASSADDFVVRNSLTASAALINGTITAQTLVVQTVSSSVVYSSGSNNFGNSITNTQSFTGSVSITGSLSLNGNSVLTNDQTASMSVLSASFASTASYVLNAISASYISGSAAIITNLTSSNDARINGINIGRGGSNVVSNTSIGTFSIRSNTSGSANTSIGYYSSYKNSIGLGNTAVGHATFYENLSGSNNSVLGRDSLANSVSGSENTVIGAYAATFASAILNGTAISSISASVIVGYLASPFSNNSINEIAIGYKAIGSGSNTVVIGNNDVTNTHLKGSITTTGAFTGSLFGTASWAQNALTASYVANASSFPYTGSAVITGSLTVTGSTNVQSISIGASQFNNTSSITSAGTIVVSLLPTSSYTSCFYNYTIASASNARSGQVMSVWNGSTVRYTEVTTMDIGNTATASFSVSLSGANVQLNFSAPGVWIVKNISNLL